MSCIQNPLLAVEQAVSNSIGVGQNQQLADADMATQDVTIEQHLYNEYQTKLKELGGDVESLASQLADNPSSQSLQAKLTAAQAKYQNEQTTEQTRTNGADSATQTAQTQAGQDSSLMQMKVQLEAAITQITQALSSALAS
jgi:hypothetical protein